MAGSNGGELILNITVVFFKSNPVSIRCVKGVAVVVSGGDIMGWSNGSELILNISVI